jgi:hypothetical protein
MISPATVTVEPPLLHDRVSRTRATSFAMVRSAQPRAFDRSSRSPAACSAAVGPAKTRSRSPAALCRTRTGRLTGVKKGSVPATNRSWSRNHTCRGTVRKPARMLTTTRLGPVRVVTVNGVLLASPMP